jgi:hypothetical protein
MKTTLVSSSIVFKSGSTKFGDTADDLHQFTGSVSFSSGLSGSLHHLAGGTSYLVAGTNVTIASASNGSVTISSTADQNVFSTIAVAGQDNVVADSATDTLTIAAAGGMTITTTAGTDTVTLSSANTNTQNTTTLSFVDSSDDIILRNTTGGEGSGTDDIKFVAGSNITLTHTDADNITIAAAASAAGSDTQVQFNDGGSSLGGDAGLVYNKTSNTLTATNLTGSLTKLSGGTSYLVAGPNILITTQSNGSILITGSAGGGGTPGGSNTQVQFNDSGGFGGDSGLVFNKTSNTLTSNNISGSLTRLSGGTSYLIAGTNVTITSASNGSITIASTDTNTTYTAGDGLDLGGTEFSLDLKSSGGLKIVSTELAIEPANFAGTGLEDDGSDNLRIASSAAGAGLTGGGASALAIGAGTGMTVNANDIAIDNGVVATISGSTFTGPIIFSQNAVTASTILDTSNNTLLSLNSSVVLNEAGGDFDFRVESANKAGMLILDAATDQILFNNSPASRFAADEAHGGVSKGGLGTDTGVYISGSRGSINTATSKGVTTIVGDLVVSGNIFHDSNAGNNSIFLETSQITTNKIMSNDPSAPFGLGRDTNTYIEFGGDQIDFFAGGVKMLTFDEGATDHITFNDGGLDVNFRVETNNLAAAIHADGGTDQVVLGGNTSTIADYLMGTDTNILLSGSIGSKGTSTKGTVVASGDMVVSGTLHNPGIVHVLEASVGNQLNISTGDYVRVDFDRGLTDTHDAWNTSTSTFTAPHDGFYQVNCLVALHTLDSATGGYGLYLTGSTTMSPKTVLLDSVSDAAFTTDTSAIGAGALPFSLRGSTCIKMNENDNFGIFVYQVGGAAQTDIYGSPDATTGDLSGTHIIITQIG